MVIEYEDKYLEDVRDLLVELEEYIVSIDEDNLDIVSADYREKMALVDLEEIKNNKGKCYLYIDNKNVVGLIMGIIPKYDENGELEGYHIYSAKMLVRRDEDGKLYLYDFVRTKKETSSPLRQ